MKRIHMEDKVTGVEWCGSVEMDKDLSNDLRRQADEGNTQALNELADMIIFHEEVENYENYIKKAASLGHAASKEVLEKLQEKRSEHRKERVKEISLILFLLMPLWGSVAAWYFYDWGTATMWFWITGLLVVAVGCYLWERNQREEEKRAAEYEKEHYDEIHYNIDLVKASPGELVKRFALRLVVDENGEMVRFGRDSYVFKERKEVFISRKSEVVEYLKEQEQCYKRYLKGLSNIEGLEEFLQDETKKNKVIDYIEQYHNTFKKNDLTDEEKQKALADFVEYYDEDYPEASAVFELCIYTMKDKFEYMSQWSLQEILSGEPYKKVMEKFHEYTFKNKGLVTSMPYGIDVIGVIRNSPVALYDENLMFLEEFDERILSDE